MKKGFTLIELLAVIVILAIIALIAVPIVLNIISDSKESSVERSAELYMDAVETAITKENLKRKFNPVECEVQNSGNLICDDDTENVLEIEMQGKKPTEGVITISNSKIEGFKNLKFENNYVSIGEEGKIIITTTKQENESGPKIITFTIDDEEYQAEEGMTWEELADSDYDVSVYLIVESSCIYDLCFSNSDSGIWDNQKNRRVQLSDIVTPNGVYESKYGGPTD